MDLVQSLLLYLLLFHFQVNSLESNQFTELLSECSCHNYTNVYECTVMSTSSGITTWNGTAFDCFDTSSSNSYIQFSHHSMFNETLMVRKSCNKDNIYFTGCSVGVKNNSYTSKLYVTVSYDINRKDIGCTHDDGNGSTSLIGSSFITGLSKIQQSSERDSLIFTWNSSFSNCPAINYNISSSNCGSCPTTTNTTTVTCTDVPTDGSLCTFNVQAMVCGEVIANMSHFYELTGSRSDSMLVPLLAVGILLFLTVVVLIGVIPLAMILLFKRMKVHHISNRDSRSTSGSMHCQKQNGSLEMETYDNVYITGTAKIFDNKLASGIYGCENEGPRVQYEEYVPTIGEGVLNLESLLVFLRNRVTFKWYKFGLALGVPSDVLEKFIKDSKENSDDKSLVAVLEYWLKNHPTQPTWQEVAIALREVIWTSKQ